MIDQHVNRYLTLESIPENTGRRRALSSVASSSGSGAGSGPVGEVGPVGGAVARAADRRRRPDVGRDVDRDAMVDEAVE